MRHIKPGRGPSMMSGVFCIFTVIVFISWTFAAVSLGAPLPFILSGVVFVIYGIVQAIYHLNNTSRKDRFSSFDITDDREEPDPFSQMYHGNTQDNFSDPPGTPTDEMRYCPWCGAKLQPGYHYCTRCGRQLP